MTRDCLIYLRATHSPLWDGFAERSPTSGEVSPMWLFVWEQAQIGRSVSQGAFGGQTSFWFHVHPSHFGEIEGHGTVLVFEGGTVLSTCWP